MRKFTKRPHVTLGWRGFDRAVFLPRDTEGRVAPLARDERLPPDTPSINKGALRKEADALYASWLEIQRQTKSLHDRRIADIKRVHLDYRRKQRSLSLYLDRDR